MPLPTTAQENFQFLLAEVIAQGGTLSKALNRGEAALLQRVIERGGYATNLKGRVQASCIETIAAAEQIPDRKRRLLAETADIAHNLERITDKYRDISREMLEVEQGSTIPTRRFTAPILRIGKALEALSANFPPSNSEAALALAREAERIEGQALKLRQTMVSELRNARRTTADLSRGILMANGLRQSADALLTISENLLAIQLGQPMKFDRFKSLRAFMQKHPELVDSKVAPVADSRSGSAISGITPKRSKKPAVIFKDGLQRKLKEERKGVESWHEMFPGLAPRILAYRKRGQSAALLIEHLPGITFEQALSHGSEALLSDASRILRKTLRSVWKETLSREIAPARFMAQLEARLPDIKAVHGGLLDDEVRIGRFRQPGFAQLVRRASKLERKLPPPFSVYIHGDFNVDNIIFDPDSQNIHFIDLHRSRYMDYVQDVSVFMVSCFRLPARKKTRTRSVLEVIREMDSTARRFARDNDDRHYDARLALGLARSFATSARFMADRETVLDMLARSRYLMTRVLDINPEYADEFRLPIKEVFLECSK